MVARLRVLLDLNVVMDVMAQRQPHYAASARVLDAAVTGEIEGLLAAHSFTTLFYLIARDRDRQVATAAVTSLANSLSVAAVDKGVIIAALALGWKDFEDAVQMAAAAQAGADYLVTRNTKDFTSGPIPVLRPEEMLVLLAVSEN